VPQVRFQPIGENSWYHADMVPPCETLCIGVPGLPFDIGMLWMVKNYRPSPREVLAAIAEGAKNGDI
jgi:hypothetical protein